MNPTQIIKRTIDARFGNAEFSKNDFTELGNESGWGAKEITTALANLKRGNYIVATGMLPRKGSIPASTVYKINTTPADTSGEMQYPPGSITIWHPHPMRPVNPGRYQVKFWDRTEGYRDWRDGTWWTTPEKTLPGAFVMAWRGVTR